MKRSSKLTIIGISFTIIIFLGLCPSQTVACRGFIKREYWPGWYWWKQTSPERQGMSSSKIEEMYEFIEANEIDLHSALIIRNGYIVNEEYLNDSVRMEQKSYYWPEAHPFIQLRDGKLHCLWSATKSVVSLLTGIAIEQGLFDLDTTFFEVFPDRWNSTLYGDHGPKDLGDAKLDITVENMLLQNSGIEWDELGDWEDWYYTDFNLDVYLTRNMSYLPGANYPVDFWTYTSGNAEMLSVMIANRSGMKMSEFARKYLFRPLKILDDEWDWWEGTSEWGSGELATKTHGGFGLFMTHRAMARIGLMCLNDGKWRSWWWWRQVVPKEWIDISTSVQINPWGTFPYGYLWWPYDNYYSASGLAGQRIIVIPEDNIVVVFTADDDYSTGTLIDFILDAVL